MNGISLNSLQMFDWQCLGIVQCNLDGDIPWSKICMFLFCERFSSIMTDNTEFLVLKQSFDFLILFGSG